MKKLIVIQNDYPGAGKTTFSRSMSRYLSLHRAQFQTIVLSEESSDAEAANWWFDPANLSLRDLIARLDEAPITLLECASDMGEFFRKFYQAHELQDLLHEVGVDLTIAVPVTSETDSYEEVIQAAECYSDNAQYLIAHTITSSYEDDDTVWDHSYAARVMDMFEAVELHVPELGFQIEQLLRSRHTDLAAILLESDPVATYGKDFGKWYKRIESQIDSVRQYLFSDLVKPLPAPAPTRRGRMAKA